MPRQPRFVLVGHPDFDGVWPYWLCWFTLTPFIINRAMNFSLLNKVNWYLKG